jgi:uncharacterized protein YndB with AHSA1/START domain
MPTIDWQGTVIIAAPVEQVYAYLADFPRHREWAQSVVELEEVHPGDSRGAGRRYRTAERQAWQADRGPRQPLTTGTKGTTMCEVRELTPNRRIAWHAWVPIPGIKHTGDFAFDLAPADGGGTRLTQTVRLHDTGLAIIVTRLVFKQTPAKARAQWAASLNNIKAILEGDGPEQRTVEPGRGGVPAHGGT